MGVSAVASRFIDGSVASRAKRDWVWGLRRGGASIELTRTVIGFVGGSDSRADWRNWRTSTGCEPSFEGVSEPITTPTIVARIERMVILCVCPFTMTMVGGDECLE